FVNSLSDLFHELVPEYYVDRMFAVMALTPQHTYQILTKRPKQMADYTRALHRPYTIRSVAESIAQERRMEVVLPDLQVTWPLPNVWMGTSAEDQRAYNERIHHLRRTLAVVRLISFEPLLGPINCSTHLEPICRCGDYRSHHEDGVGACVLCNSDGMREPWDRCRGYDQVDHGISWCIVGGESGPHFRAMDLDWAHSLRDQTVSAGSAFFYKQSSGPRPGMGDTLDGRHWHQFPDGKGGVVDESEEVVSR
ncbi:MAG: DUF5131 family protein, partial [Patescibacteria group bacterium]|nr:DUF5131 family protein [Patescibacteria group bacterium]